MFPVGLGARLYVSIERDDPAGAIYKYRVTTAESSDRGIGENRTAKTV